MDRTNATAMATVDARHPSLFRCQLSVLAHIKEELCLVGFARCPNKIAEDMNENSKPSSDPTPP